MSVRRTRRRVRASRTSCARYRDSWVGTRVVFTDWQGGEHYGTVTGWCPQHRYPVATLDNGWTARLDLEVTVVGGRR